MNTITIFAFLVSVCCAAPQQNPDALATILREENDNIGLGAYKYSYETSNGILAEEQGEVKNANSENANIAVTGQFSFVADDGKTYTVSYVADENGFRPQTGHSGNQGRGSTLKRF